MPATIAPPEPQAPPRTDSFGGGGQGATPPDGGGFGGDGYGDSNGPEARGWSSSSSLYRTGIWVGLASIVMFFAAITSVLVVRAGISNDWVLTAIPHILYLNTAVLIASSVTLELARRSLINPYGAHFVVWLTATAVLGLGFLAGQLEAWRELADRGVYLASNPSSSFFYLITAAHGVHLIGGIAALLYVICEARSIREGRKNRAAVDVTTIYWHFMDGLWIYLFILIMTRL